MIKNRYKFCSICGEKLIKKKDSLHCSKCSFVNYRNPRPTVTALMLHKNKLLFCRRKNPPFKDWWDIIGGFIDKGESPDGALRRELREETGLSIKKTKLFGVYAGVYPDSFDPSYVLSIVYVVWPSDIKTVIRDKEEISELKWFHFKNLPKNIAFDSNRRTLKDFMKSNIWS